MEALILRLRAWLRGLRRKLRARVDRMAGFLEHPPSPTAILDRLLLTGPDGARRGGLWFWLTVPFRWLWRLVRWTFRTLWRTIRGAFRLLWCVVRWIWRAFWQSAFWCMRMLVWLMCLPFRGAAWPGRWLKRRRAVRTLETGARPPKPFWTWLLAPLRAVRWCFGLLFNGLSWPFRRLFRRWQDRKYRRLRDLPISVSFVTYTLCAFLVGTLVCMVVTQMCDARRMQLYYKYRALSESYMVPDGGRYAVRNNGSVSVFRIYDVEDNLVDTFTVDFQTEELIYDSDVRSIYQYYGGEHRSELEITEEYHGPHGFIVTPLYTSRERFINILLASIQVLILPVGYGGALIICAILFYRRKLKTPISILRAGSARIAQNELDFSISYDSRNEMGQLCESFETMRSALQQNNMEMWRNMEERRRLNAVFAHDLRTPLTVLKGHASMLISAVPEGSITSEEILYEVRAMSTHITRLENYVEAMARLQRLEDVEIRRETISFERLAQSLKDSAEILCASKSLNFESIGLEPAVCVDEEIVQQVYENILSNGVRFAASTIRICVEAHGGGLWITVQDDGPGFSPDGLKKATHPFYKAKESTNDGHLGLGLNICKILCQRHGGDVRVMNASGGGAIVEATF